MQELFNAGQILGRSEMKKIMAGSGSGGCQVYYSDGGGWTGSDGGCDLNHEEAQSLYSGSSNVTGYCCSSCGSGNFSNASSC